MRYIKWSFLAVLALIVFATFHYLLPQHDVVRITSTEVIRTDFSRFNRIFYAQADAGATENETRDIRLINAVRPNGRVIVYRNEDTGWIWPPYFKFDSSNLQAEAHDESSTRDAPRWVSVTHYGWRNEFFSIYPNAVGVKVVDGPDVKIVPWFNIVFLSLLALALLMIRRMWMQFRERSIDPMVESMEDKWDDAGDSLAEKRGRMSRWLDSWKTKK
ncbi:DUF1523 family protein [Thalassovita taeanensis]|uniref:DUF1523 domain-containing protein n=1 Tax=Thalassovita taeanensis TaxID=657014 RepID=A0A1H9FEV7_9RHOB|nr:DUF1523 family protein [Thalassovita taeanensis]SEQ35828.1 Protein of unknown function [Thalassovita taeanensis]